ncbi:MAG: hypothetical protein ACE5Q3_13640 [Alphaproteobacteria bacterium]
MDRHAQKFVAPVPCHLASVFVHIEKAVRVRIYDENPVAGLLEQAAEPLFIFSERLFRLPAVELSPYSLTDQTKEDTTFRIIVLGGVANSEYMTGRPSALVIKSLATIRGCSQIDQNPVLGKVLTHAIRDKYVGVGVLGDVNVVTGCAFQIV